MESSLRVTRVHNSEMATLAKPGVFSTSDKISYVYASNSISFLINQLRLLSAEYKGRIGLRLDSVNRENCIPILE
jgi:hypothetical protein